MADGRVKVGMIGSQFQADIQVTSSQMGYEAEVVAVASPTPGTGEDGLMVMRALYAGYASAGEGRKITLPYQPPSGVKRPIDLWLNGPAYPKKPWRERKNVS